MTSTTIDDHAALLSDRNLDEGRGEKAAIITDGGDEVTFAQVHRDACRFGSRLQGMGVRRGERVVLVMDDTPRFHSAFLGAMRIGAVPIPTNFLANADDFTYFMADSYAVATVVDAPFLEKVAAGADELGVPLLVGGDPDGGHERTVEAFLADGEDELDPASTHAEDAAFWLYSSGSTGRPKGVVHTHEDIAATCRNYAEGVLDLHADDVTFSTTKLFHAYGLGNGLSFPMWVGATAVQMAGKPLPDKALDRIEQHSPSVLFSVPALYTAMLQQPDIAERDLSSIRLNASAAEALPGEVFRQWQERTGTEILDGIGSTEMLHIYCSNRPGHVVPGSSGTPVPGYELQLRDEHGDVVGTQEGTGDLYVAGGSRLQTYWHQKDKTERCIHGEWFFTGDRYRRDGDGTYWYEGRADDMMKVKGLWVSPIEIENRLIEHEAVAEAAVVGADNEEGMTRIRAQVILLGGHEGSDELTEELQTWCKDKLLRYQFPHEVEYVEDFPRTATGKIQRFKIRGEAVEA